MIRKIAMVLVAVAAVTAGSASTAAARHGMGGGMGGGFSHSSMGGSFGHSFSGGGFSHFDHDRFGRFDHDRFGHHRFGNRFGVFGVGGYPYGYGDGCYSRVWTPWGWRLRYVCY
jgi:hypothetical protein